MAVSPEIYEYRFTCPLPNGIHARPANTLEQIVSGFSSNVLIENLSKNKVADARSILSLIGADINRGDECILKVQGDDSADAFHKIVHFLQNEFIHCDEPLPQTAQQTGPLYIPPVLRAAGIPVFQVNPVVNGFGRGYVIHIETIDLSENIKESVITNTQDEIQKIDKAVTSLRNDITLKLEKEGISRIETKILRAHLSIAGDTVLLDKIFSIIKEQKVSAGKAIHLTMEHFSAILRNAQSQLIRQRIADLRDICTQVYDKIYDSASNRRITLTRPSVCIAAGLSPAQFISINKNFLSALVLGEGGNTSHTAILARSFGIPTVTGLIESDIQLENGQDVIVDANYGLFLPAVNDRVERFYAFEQHRCKLQQTRLAAVKDKPAVTRDGATIEIMANISLADEIPAAMQNGADGIGLFRTEMLLMARQCLPTRQEQFEEYKKAAVFAAGKPVIIRTFDLGGDKSVPYLKLPDVDIVSAKARGVNIYKYFENLFLDQLTAILQASVFGNLKIMIPMVTCVDDILYTRNILKQAKARLDLESVPYNPSIPFGIMVENPSAAHAVTAMAAHIDFISIGTNDLVQYCLNLDRGDKQADVIYQFRHPAAISMIKKVIEEAHTHRLRVGMCGEAAGRFEYLPLLLGAGIDDLSMSTPHILQVKDNCRQYDSRDCRKILEKAVQSQTIEQINSILRESDTENRRQPVMDIQLTNLQADCVTKEETIKYLADMLYVNQRTNDFLELEKDFWRREEVYSTGLGYGIAIPHCKTSHIRSNSICFLRLKQPVVWGSLDDKPVDMVISITIQDVESASQAHMKIFSKLARSIMHAQFRQQLREIYKEESVVSFLREKLELGTQ